MNIRFWHKADVQIQILFKHLLGYPLYSYCLNALYLGGEKRFYLLLPCLILGACAATPPWGSPGGHVYGGHQALYSRGHCPPGLAKKGCIPPGQATKWRRGYPLAQDVIYYNLSPRMARRIGIPPAGYHYVRVTQDILMIATGTGIVVDAVYDLSNM